MDTRDYVRIETALSRKLLGSWRGIAYELYKKTTPLIKDGKFLEARELVTTLDMSPIVTANSSYIRAMFWSSIMFGAKVAADSESPLLSSLAFEKTLGRVHKEFLSSVELLSTQYAVSTILQLIARAEADAQKVTKAETVKRYVRSFTSFKEGGDTSLMVTSGLHTSRLATWGFTAEAEVRGISTYKLVAVLDGRTSAFCQMINGKTFSVKDARASIVKILDIEDPNEVKTLQPFPNQSKASMENFSSLTPEQLVEQNLHIPPFHPGCRTICVLSSRSYVTTPIGPIEQVDPQTAPVKVTLDDFDILKNKPTQNDLVWWNQVVGTSPISVLSTISAMSPDSLIGKALAKSISFDKDGSISWKVAGRKDYTLISTQKFDPLASTLTVTNLTLNGTSVTELSGVFKSIMSESKKLADQIGASVLSVGVKKDLELAQYVKLGFLPSKEAWAILSDEIRFDLTSGDYSVFYQGLSTGQRKVVTDALNSTDPRAMYILLSLDYKVGGVYLDDVLTSGRSAKLTLDLKDQLMVKVYEDSLR